MRAIRVMHILSDLDVGGAQRVVLDIVSNLDRSKFKPYVCTLRSGGSMVAKLEEEHIPHSLAYFSSRFSLIGLWRLAELIRENEIDIVHTHLRRSNISGRLAAMLAGVKVIVAHSHDTLIDKKFLHKKAGKWLNRHTDAYLCISDAVKKVQAQAQGESEDFYTTLYNFINPQMYRTDLSPQLAKADLGIPVESPCVGIVGRLHPLKGHDMFLDAAFEINQKRPDIHFAIIGDGNLKENLKEKARRLGMVHKVSFVGLCNDMARVYRALDCLALCSSSEGLGMVLLEAQAAGVPVVANSVGGVPEVLEGGGGLLVENADSERMSVAILEALKPSVAAMLRKQMPDNLKRFSAARQITILEDLYEDLCNEKGVF
jgi:glycosyltransferase involved in cell wall biosynthesis